MTLLSHNECMAIVYGYALLTIVAFVGWRGYYLCYKGMMKHLGQWPHSVADIFRQLKQQVKPKQHRDEQDIRP